MVLGSRKLLLLPVNRPAARGKDDLPYPIFETALEEADHTHHVHLRIESRFAHGASYIDLGSVVRDRFGFKIFEDFATARADVYS